MELINLTLEILNKCIQYCIHWNCITCNAKNNPCTAAENKTVISASGQVIPCEAFKFLLNDPNTPNVFKMPLKDIWENNKLMTDIRVANAIMRVAIDEKDWNYLWTQGVQGIDWDYDNEGCIILHPKK